jgi:glucose/arabinose dehydrogenase
MRRVRCLSREEKIMSCSVSRVLLWGALVAPLALAGREAHAQDPTPSLVDRRLAVRTAATGLEQPVNLAFLGRNDMLVLEKATGRVQRVVDGAVTATVLDLPVNSASERGLLSIALHPDFEDNGFVYLFWTETLSGADSEALEDVPLLGNRVDRYVWDGSALTFDINLIQLRAFQADDGQPLRGNHNGGVLVFGKKERRGPSRGRGRRSDANTAKLYVQVGDGGRRGQLQNLEDGPFGPGQPDDQFGGPEPDDAHFTGVILRLNDDGTAPEDNPFFEHGEEVGGEVGANIQKIFAYGIRNGFGMAVDPRTGHLWEQENGDDSFSELNRVSPGMNSGWVQIMGPVERIAEYKAIETDTTAPQPFAPNGYFGLQQIRWPPTNIADSPEEALERLFMLPGAHYSRPEMSWKFEVSPGGIGFVEGRGLGGSYRHDLIMGNARPELEGGHLFHFNLTGDRRRIRVTDRRLRDGVADNRNKFDIQESESLLFGRNFGTVVDIKSGPNGNLYVVSLTHGNVYEIFRRRPRGGR